MNISSRSGVQSYESKQTVRQAIKVVDGLSILALLILYAAGAVLIVFYDPKHWIGLIYDDGYYYLGIVRSFVEAGISAFLPPFQTNGYQPLWFLVLSAMAMVFGTSDTSLGLQLYSLSFICVGIFAYLSKRLYGMAFPAIVSAAVFPFVTLLGLETTMVPPLVLALFSAKDWKSRGLLSSLLFLARLDALAFIVCHDVHLFVAEKKRSIRHYFILAPVMAMYFLWNYQMFGSPVPISGLAKAVGNFRGENLYVIHYYASQLNLPLAVFLSVLVSSLMLTARARIRFKRELIILSGTFAIACAYYTVFSGWPVLGWYYWPATLLLYYAITSGGLFITENHTLVSKLGMRKVAFSLTPMTLVALYLVSHTTLFPRIVFSRYLNARSDTFAVKNLELVDFIKQGNFPTGTLFAMGDRAGSFGFFLGPKYQFIHTEGLVGPLAYYESLKNDLGAQFLRSHRVNYLIAERDRFIESGDDIGVVEPVQGLSTHVGPYLLCFNKQAIVLDQSYVNHGVLNRRYVFDFSKEISCPLQIADEFNEMRARYGFLRKFTLYSEYGRAEN